MTSFENFGLLPAVSQALARMNYTTPTQIQAQAIPPALQGRDIVGSAQTGTGKTAAFCIPLVTHLINNPKATALVMTPTRELATQVLTVVQQIANRDTGIRTALLIGGDSMSKQFRQLESRPRLIVGTPGRINDHLRRNKKLLQDTNFLVLDEADRMLDMGFSVQIDEVLKFLHADRQTLMFSATFPPKIIDFSKRYMNNPVRVAVQSERPTADNITHDIIRTTDTEKYGALVQELNAREGSVIIFVKTKRGADRLAKRLHGESLNAEAIHGDLKQSRRERVIKDFRDKRHRILVATDVAARGLDVPHVEHVINYDLPQVPEDYIHRIGRTARAGAKGSALCFVMPSDNRQWAIIARILDPNAHGGGSGYEGGAGGRSGRPPANRNAKSRRPFKQGPRYGAPKQEGGGYRGGNRDRSRDDNRDGNRADNRGNSRDDNRGNTRNDNRGNERSAEPRSQESRKPFHRGSGNNNPNGSGGYKGPRNANAGNKGSDNNRSESGNRSERSDRGFNKGGNNAGAGKSFGFKGKNKGRPDRGGARPASRAA